MIAGKDRSDLDCIPSEVISTPTATSSRYRSRDVVSFLLEISAYLVLGVRFFWIIWRYAVNVFYWAEWEFNEATLFERHSWWQIFRWQYGPHRQGLGGIVSKLVEPVAGWNCRFEAFAIGTVIFVVSLLALWLKKRLYGRIDAYDVIVPMLFLTPVQYESMIGTHNFSHPSLPMLFVVLYCIAWTMPSYPWKYMAVLSINFAAIHTGFGFFLGPLTPVAIVFEYFRKVRHLSRNHRITSAAALLISLLSLGSFFIGYKWWPSVDCSLKMQHPGVYFLFIDVMFASFLGVKVGKLLVPAILLGGFTLLAALIVMGVYVKKLTRDDLTSWTRSLVTSILMAYCLIFSLNAAAGRICLGLGAAQASRYTSYLSLGFFAFYLAALSVRDRVERKAAILAVLVLALLSSARITEVDRLDMQDYSRRRQAWKDCYLAHHDIPGCDSLADFQVLPWSTPEELKEKRLQEKLDFLERNHLNLFSDTKPDR